MTPEKTKRLRELEALRDKQYIELHAARKARDEVVPDPKLLMPYAPAENRVDAAWRALRVTNEELGFLQQEREREVASARHRQMLVLTVLALLAALAAIPGWTLLQTWLTSS